MHIVSTENMNIDSYELAIDDVGVYTTTNGLKEITKFRHSDSITETIMTPNPISQLLSIEATSPGTQPLPKGKIFYNRY